MNLPGPHRSYRGWSIIRLFTIAALVLIVYRSPMDAQAEGAQPDMALRLQQILKETPDKNLYLGTKDIRKWRAWLESPPFYAKAADKVWAMMELGIAELRYGQEKEAVQHLGQAFKLGRESQVEAKQLGECMFFLGIAYLRFAETQNCCQKHSPESCTLPIRGAGLHTKQEGSKNAMVAFSQVLRLLTPKEPKYHSARWLLNVTAMTLGTFPEAVPTNHRIQLDRVTPQGDRFPAFPNVAQKAGVNSFNLAGGAIADDFNGDGWIDIMTSSWDTGQSLTLFLNQGQGTFKPVVQQAGLETTLGGLNLIQTDYNNDGLLDVLVLRGAWLAENGRHPNSLLRHDGVDEKGIPHFTDVSYQVGLAGVDYPTQTASWADYDLDGDLDLFIGNESTEGITAPCQLFRNDGDRFVDVAAQSGVLNHRFAKGVIWGDYDGDRYPDLYLSNMDGENRMYRNQGDGTFSEVTMASGTPGTYQSFPAWFWDYDNDGALDLFSSFFSPDAGFTASHYFGYAMQDQFLPGMYRNQGDGSFKNEAKALGVNLPIMPMGCNFGDINNDGWLDFFLGTGNVGLQHVTPNLMFVNREGKRFENVTLEGGFGHLQKGHSIGFADFDNDGDLDIFAQMGGAFPADKYYDALYQNPGFGNAWLGVLLKGKQSNRAAIGARIKVQFEDAGEMRTVYRHVNSGGSFGANPLRQWLGLGQAKEVRTLEIFWPRTGETQTFEGVACRRTILIEEGSQTITHLEPTASLVPPPEA